MCAFNSTLRTRPIDTKIDNIAEPPYDTSGSGIPTTGIRPDTIDIFIIT